MTMATPSVYIGCLRCHNDGVTVGTWCYAEDADEVTPEEVHDHETTHSELWCLDHEGFGGLLDGEVSPAEAARVARVIAELDDEELVEAFAVWRRDEGRTDEIDSAELAEFRDQFVGIYDDAAAFAYELATELGDVPDGWPYTNIDWAAAARDLFWSGEYARAELPNGRLAVWRSC